ncbi:hypothetical protein B0H10DRAFT_2443702 [Mycena sp. CBHHK59/15]|nr:hypothetical protein B0H10DRAFT_2443702 [Mycena sp. CBHHK59/15]
MPGLPLAPAAPLPPVLSVLLTPLPLLVYAIFLLSLFAATRLRPHPAPQPALLPTTANSSALHLQPPLVQRGRVRAKSRTASSRRGVFALARRAKSLGPLLPRYAAPRARRSEPVTPRFGENAVAVPLVDLSESWGSISSFSGTSDGVLVDVSAAEHLVSTTPAVPPPLPERSPSLKPQFHQDSRPPAPPHAFSPAPAPSPPPAPEHMTIDPRQLATADGLLVDVAPFPSRVLSLEPSNPPEPEHVLVDVSVPPSPSFFPPPPFAPSTFPAHDHATIAMKLDPALNSAWAWAVPVPAAPSPPVERAASPPGEPVWVPQPQRAASPPFERPVSPRFGRAMSPPIERAASPRFGRTVSPPFERPASPLFDRAASPPPPAPVRVAAHPPWLLPQRVPSPDAELGRLDPEPESAVEAESDELEATLPDARAIDAVVRGMRDAHPVPADEDARVVDVDDAHEAVDVAGYGIDACPAVEWDAAGGAPSASPPPLGLEPVSPLDLYRMAPPLDLKPASSSPLAFDTEPAPAADWGDFAEVGDIPDEEDLYDLHETNESYEYEYRYEPYALYENQYEHDDREEVDVEEGEERAERGSVRAPLFPREGSDYEEGDVEDDTASDHDCAYAGDGAELERARRLAHGEPEVQAGLLFPRKSSEHDEVDEGEEDEAYSDHDDTYAGDDADLEGAQLLSLGEPELQVEQLPAPAGGESMLLIDFVAGPDPLVDSADDPSLLIHFSTTDAAPEVAHAQDAATGEHHDYSYTDAVRGGGMVEVEVTEEDAVVVEAQEANDPAELALPSFPLPISVSVSGDEEEEVEEDPAELALPSFPLPSPPRSVEEVPAPALDVQPVPDAPPPRPHLLVPAPVHETDLGAPSPSPSSASSSTPLRPSPRARSVALGKGEEAEDEEDDLGAPPPAWAVRAADAPALGLSASSEPPGAFPLSSPAPASTSTSVTPKSTALSASSAAPRARTRRSPLDVALAMQLRPGLGVGAEGAWMVRFLMSFFGWFAILVGGGREFS